MPYTDDFGRSIPVGTDPADLNAMFTRYSLTDGGLPSVSSLTAANQLRSNVNTVADSNGLPHPRLFVWRTDTKTLEVHPNTGAAGEGWEVVGGRQHGATATFDNPDVTTATVHALYLNSLTRASEGFTVDGQFNLVVPATGLYTITLATSYTGTVFTGRAHSEIVLNDGSSIARFPAGGEDKWTGTTQYALTAGYKLKVQTYQASGSTRGMSSTMTLAMAVAPRW